MIKILHIEKNYKMFYFLVKKGILIKSKITLKAAVSMIKKGLFDLVLFEPHHLAVINPKYRKRFDSK